MLGMWAFTRMGGKATGKQCTVQKLQGWQKLATPLFSHLAPLALRNTEMKNGVGVCQSPRAGSVIV